MTNRIDHTDCSHEATSKARAACRKARAAGLTTFFLVIDADGVEVASYLEKDQALHFAATHRSGRLIHSTITSVTR